MDSRYWNTFYSSYVRTYIERDVRDQLKIVDQLSFYQFMKVIASRTGQEINLAGIAKDCGISANTIKEYFQILEDTLLGFYIPAYTKTIKRKIVQAPRFYLFDVGVTNYLLGRKDLKRGSVEYGHAFEHFVLQELVAYLSYTDNSNRISYWRTYTQIEVDVILGDAKVAIEIKSAEEVMSKHLKGLKAFREEYPDTRLMVVSLDKLTRTSDGIEIVYIYDFLKMLWKGEII